MDGTSIKSVWQIIKRLYTFTIEHFWGWGLVRLIIGIASASLNLFHSKIIGGMIDVVISADMARLMSFIIALVSVWLFRTAVGGIGSMAHSRYCSLSGRKYRQYAAERINTLPLTYYENRHSGETMSRIISDIEKIQVFYGDSVAGIWSFTPTMMIVGSIILLGINWKLTLICMTILPLVTYFFNKISIPIANSAEKMQAKTGEMNSYLRDFIEGSSIYKVFNMKKTHTSKYEDACDEVTNHSFKILNRKAVLRGVANLSQLFPWVFTYAIGGIYVSRGEMSIGELYTFANVIQPFAGSFFKIGRSWTEMVEVAGMARHFFKLLDEEPERSDGEDFSGVGAASVIEFDNVSYAYIKDDPVLTDCTFNIKYGSRTALVGGSGSGKSTIQKMICGFYDDYEGTIRINGCAQSDWKLRDLRQNIAYVGQDIFLFSDTLMENIRMGKIDATDEEVMEAARRAYAHDFIMEMKSGYQTRIGERGMKLSGGQRQRIAIARAILKDAPIILLDEPTSALDTKSEYYVQKAIENLEMKKTVVVIAHRLSTIENSDEILVLDEGRIIDRGTHRELIGREGRYSDLYQLYDEEEDLNEGIY